MSWTSRLFLYSSIAVSGGTVYYVHCLQSIEREELRAGVLRDVERRAQNASRKAENLYILNQQKELEKFLKKEQETRAHG
ncbi:protein pet117, mitochondrial [Fopius arisanus]|uniref:Protein pet117, mitochondrial n=1 Tax=Fopius arisanus TaxID=64838 RepID=A0A9R1SXR1_9HYME|nr:PREDICTED: protein pet117, mitochondrial-like [Fopius arisanus]